MHPVPRPSPPFRFSHEDLPRRLGGYARWATEQLLGRVAISYETVWHECLELREQLKDLEVERARREEAERLLGAALIEARREAVTIRHEARKEMEAMLRKARRRARSMIAEADREAKAHANEILADARREHNRVQAEIRSARAFLDETHEDLSSYLAAAFRWYRRSTTLGTRSLEAPRELDVETLELLSAEELPAGDEERARGLA